MAIEGEFSFLDREALKGTIGGHNPTLGNIGKIGRHDLADNLGLDCCIMNFNQRLHPAIEVASHPVGGRYEDTGLF